ncbi:MAG TPA: HD domain-containing protein, partial [Geobacterales bacterium]|nr:HD domain-containing protein [Geobacterales bacterium]
MAGLGEYVSWFDRYRRSFVVASAAEQRNLDLKADHTCRVQENMGVLVEELGIAEPMARLARLIALFHDVGRFPQYCRYKTFKDSESENHGALGARVLVEEGVLSKLSERERSLVIRGVTLHNVFALPAGLDGESLLLLQLIRDADKLDIWRVFIEYYTAPPEERADAV